MKKSTQQLAEALERVFEEALSPTNDKLSKISKRFDSIDKKSEKILNYMEKNRK